MTEQLTTEWTPCMKLPVVVHVRQQREGESHVSTREGITPVKPDDLIVRGVSGEEYPIGREIFEQTYSLDLALAQPAAWVGLTEEEADDCFESVMFSSDVRPTRLLITRAIETKLKEKNT